MAAYGGSRESRILNWGEKYKLKEEYAPKQTYDNYYREWLKNNPEKRRQYTNTYRYKLTAKWGVSYVKAAKLERESKLKGKDES